jgi:hypothetical protein
MLTVNLKEKIAHYAEAFAYGFIFGASIAYCLMLGYFAGHR